MLPLVYYTFFIFTIFSMKNRLVQIFFSIFLLFHIVFCLFFCSNTIFRSAHTNKKKFNKMQYHPLWTPYSIGNCFEIQMHLPLNTCRTIRSSNTYETVYLNDFQSAIASETIICCFKKSEDEEEEEKVGNFVRILFKQSLLSFIYFLLASISVFILSSSLCSMCSYR